MSLAEKTFAMIQRQAPRPRVGVVEAVDTVSRRCVLMIAGAAITGLPWSGPEPIVGRTAMLRSGVVWMLSAAPVTAPDQVSVLVPPAETVDFQWRKLVFTGTDYRVWSAPASTPAIPPSWDLQQGAWISESPAFPGYSRRATLARYDLAGIVPEDATDVIVQIHLHRDFDIVSNRAIRATSPVLHGIDYDPLPDNSADPETAPEPETVDGFTDWRPGEVLPGERAVFQLPEAWQLALLEGTLTGLLTASPQIQDEAWFRSGSAPYTNGCLQVAYTPTEEAP